MKDRSASRTSSPGERAASYWFEDGIPELAYGVALTLSDGAALAWALYVHTIPILIVAVTFYLGLVALLAWDQNALTLIKARITFPRTGYVQPPGTEFDPLPQVQSLGLTPEAPPARGNFSWFRLRIVLLIVSPLALLVFDQPWALPALMILLALLFYFTSRQSEVTVSLWSALGLAVLGCLPVLIGSPGRGRVLIAGILGGFWLMLRGLWKFALYIHKNPDPQVKAGAGV